MVVEAAPVVPLQEDCRRVPVGALHGGIDDGGDVRLALVDARRRVLAVGLRRGDPGDSRQFTFLGCGEVAVQRVDVAQLVILLHVLEQGQRVPDPRGQGVLLYRRTGERGVVRAVGLVARLHVVRPRDVMVVEEPGEIRPGIRHVGRARAEGLVDVALHLRRRVGAVDLVAAARRLGVRTDGRPTGDEVEVIGERPRVDGLEHLVVEDEVLGVGPIVRDLGRGVVPHDVGRGGIGACGIRGVEAPLLGGGRLRDEAVHGAIVDVRPGVRDVVRTTAVDVVGVVVRRLAAATRDGHTHAGRDATGAWIRAEVTVEGPVFLLDDDDVLDLVDAGRHDVVPLRAPADPLALRCGR